MKISKNSKLDWKFEEKIPGNLKEITPERNKNKSGKKLTKCEKFHQGNSKPDKENQIFLKVPFTQKIKNQLGNFKNFKSEKFEKFKNGNSGVLVI